MARVWSIAVIALAWVAIPPAPAPAKVVPNPLFCDGMVLQRGMPVPIWGTAGDGEKVTVKFQGQEASTTARDGTWMVRLKELEAGGPFELSIAGENEVDVKDVLVGEVWICSGQSNMAFTVDKSAEGREAVASSDDPKLRLFTVARGTAQEPRREVQGRWQVAGTGTVGS